MDSIDVIEGFLLGVGAGVIITLAAVAWLLANVSWRKANLAGVRIPFLGIVGMRLRGTPPPLIIDAAVTVAMRGHAVPWTNVEAAYLAHGHAGMDSFELVDMVEKQLVESDA